jgi:hypothetical protein
MSCRSANAAAASTPATPASAADAATAHVRPHQETAMDPDPHPRGAIATLPPALSFSRLPGPAPETSAHPQG